ncbi:MAG: mucoidy inhibitor MuiA family protein, partial [Aestuariivirgaceae bacterium]
MRTTLFALLAATTFLSPVSAAEIGAESKIDAVTVYPQGAEITRTAEVAIAAGDHTLVLDDLPGDIDAQSIRVEGETGAAVEIGSVDSKVVHITGGAEFADRRKQLEGEIETLRDEAAALGQLMKNIDYQRQLIQDLARQPFVAQKSSETALKVDSAELGNLFDLVSVRLQALDKRGLEAGIRNRKVNEEIGDLQKKLSELSPKQTVKSVVTVNLSSEAATSGMFKIKYRIHNAGWRPFYDARLSVPENEAAPAMSLVRRAEIVQRTTESWDDVALTLSTARPVGATSAPDLPAFALGFAQNEMFESKQVRRKLFLDQAGRVSQEAAQPSVTSEDAKPEEDLLKAEQRQAEIAVAGFQALYAIPGRVSIDNEGTAKKVEISTDTISASLSAHAVPMLDPNAYLTAKFTVNGETPLLPGRVLLFRDNVYMGQGALPLLSPGEDHALGFGTDDRIKIKRKELH